MVVVVVTEVHLLVEGAVSVLEDLLHVRCSNIRGVDLVHLVVRCLFDVESHLLALPPEERELID